MREALRGSDGDVDTALLLVSELVTNAVLHAKTAIGLTVAQRAGTVRVSVADDSPEGPVRRAATLDSFGGRGMTLIDTLATRWGVERHPGDGKTVWFELQAC